MYIEKLDNKGRGITYKNNKITFVENALEGEDVEIKITNEKAKYNEAIVVKYNNLSKDRSEVKCPYYDYCGGCDLLHFKYKKELEFKKKKVMDILKKFGGIEFKINNIISPVEYNYRNKATFQVKEKVGYYGKKSYNIINIDNCLIVDERINDILRRIKKLNLKNIYQLIIRVSQNDSMLIIKCDNDIDNRFKELNLTSIIMFKNKKYEVIKGQDYIIEVLGNLKFIISPDSFFQVNTCGAVELYNKVLEYSNLTGTEKVLDLYCGTGTIGLFLSKCAGEVVGVEINRSAINDALKNKKLNYIENIEFICDDASNINLSEFDLIIVDPPRKGIDQKTINYLLNSGSKKIIYVSCDPVTLARDLKKLKEKYEVKDITLVNMFSKTEHCESVVLLYNK